MMNEENEVNAVGGSLENGEVPAENANESPELSKEQKEQHLNELLSNGRRAIRVNDIEKATEILSEATELSIDIYGENHENTFEPYYYYGMAALELAKLESQLLQNPEKKETEQDKEESHGQEAGSTEEKYSENGDDSDKEEGEESGEEDDDSMRLAWEVLETARCIATAKIEKLEAEREGISLIEEWNLKLADVLVLLGEHGMADEKGDQAREDLDRALDIQKNFLPADSRKIAQTYMLVANACSNSMNFTESIVFYEKTKECLLNRQASLKKEVDAAEDEEKKSEINAELKDLEEMIPGVDNLISDATSSAEQVAETTKAIKTQFSGFTSMLAQLPKESDADDKKVNDISSLVRRPGKRPTEISAENDDVKKSKDENTI
uniref:SHNi-TPR domain-containing protein n=1 Tax=Caenorhabditis tropicalis TaxID=1561998 RepID=A0A1I7U9V6_9PELO